MVDDDGRLANLGQENGDGDVAPHVIQHATTSLAPPAGTRLTRALSRAHAPAAGAHVITSTRPL